MFALLFVGVGLLVATSSAAHVSSFHLIVPGCNEPFSPVGDSCLYLAKTEQLSHPAAREYCQGLGGDLVVFKDANHYADALDYIRNKNGWFYLWIGGEFVEDEWVWITGEMMPQGSPFWGHYMSVPQPGGDVLNENCAQLNHDDRYYIHDSICNKKETPLCQIIPKQVSSAHTVYNINVNIH